jgi:hypothetical protein
MSQPAPDNGRQHRCHRERPRGNTPLTCYRRAGGTDLAVSLLDVSQSGIRLVVREPLEVADAIEVWLARREVGPPLRLPAEVVWCLATAEGAWCVGAKFHDYLPFRDLDAIAGL